MLAHHVSWNLLKNRVENSALNGILFGTFTAPTSTFFYRYTMLQSSNANAKLINLDHLLFSVILFFFSVSIRYLGHFIFLHACPDLIRNHKDKDDLLKKAKDTIIDEKDWPVLSNNQIDLWNKTNYSVMPARLYLLFNEVLVLATFFAGAIYFVLSVWQFLRQASLAP